MAQKMSSETFNGFLGFWVVFGVGVFLGFFFFEIGALTQLKLFNTLQKQYGKVDKFMDSTSYRNVIAILEIKLYIKCNITRK